MEEKRQLRVKLVHCGNRNIAHPEDSREKYVFYMPMGIFSLARVLEEDGEDVEIIHLDLEPGKDFPDIFDYDGLDAVGFDLHWAGQGRVVMDTARALKRQKPDLFIFLGGYTATYYAEEILTEHDYIDAVIRGDGETPLSRLCRALKDNREDNPKDNPKDNLAEVPNLVWRDGDRRVRFNDWTYVSDRDELNRFDFAGLELLRNWQRYRDLSRYWTRFPQFQDSPLFFVEMGRGCVYNCTICGGNSSAQLEICHRTGQAVRSVESVMETVRKANSYGYTCFFTCYDFENHHVWYSRFFEAVRKEKLERPAFKELQYAYECWSLPTRRQLDEMSATFRDVLVTISPDTAVPCIRENTKDRRLCYANRELEATLDTIAGLENVKVQLYFGYYLPGDTAETVTATMRYMLELYARYGEFTEITYMEVNTDPGSNVYNRSGDYGLDIRVRRFADYLQVQTDHGNRERTGGLQLLSWPAALGVEKASALANRVNLINRLLNFRRTMTRLLKHQNDPAVIQDSLKLIVGDHRGTNEVSFEKIKEILSALIRLVIGEDREMTELLREEYLELLRGGAGQPLRLYGPTPTADMNEKNEPPDMLAPSDRDRIDDSQKEKFDEDFDFG